MPNLILIPTAGERAVMEPLLQPTTSDDRWRIELCGFGIAAAAARTAMLVERHRPERVILTGTAGTFDEELAVGEAFNFSRVGCYGIGAGSGDEFITAGEMGWRHWRVDGSFSIKETDCTDSGIGDLLELSNVSASADRLLLTACAASANAEDLRRRREKFPRAAAEDMEGFGVAVACRMAEIPLQIIRGISNQAGDRDKTHWKTNAALQSAATVVIENTHCG
ncbi:MAG: futalosine hydrolase [Planctomycetaceae bacterium]